MKVQSVCISLLAFIAIGSSSAAAASVASGFAPYRLSFEALTATGTTGATNEPLLSSLFWEALTEIGMVSVTDLPVAAQQAARDMVQYQHACLTAPGGEGSEGEAAQVHVFGDGTVRRTLATHTVAGVGGRQRLKHGGSEACAAFARATNVFRDTTHQAVTAFAAKITEALQKIHQNSGSDSRSDSRGPLLVTAPTKNHPEPFGFATFSDIVKYGEHLEHFHSYQKKIATVATTTTESISTGTTIDLHTDQGLFLTFTPGRMSPSGELTKGFFIQMPNGDLEQVNFSDRDEIVFMLGDGVNQYVNNNNNNNKLGESLRAVPHALRLEESSSTTSSSSSLSNARVWYGLMVLPPAAALHPVHNVTFRQIRQGLIQPHGPVRDEALRLACSDVVISAQGTHRGLHGADDTNSSSTCLNTTELYCWHQCLNLSLYQLSSNICQETFQVLQCVNPRGQLWDGQEHGDYFPGCADTTAVVETPFPTLPDYPRNEAACASFDAFVANETYVNSVTLNNGNGAVFQYTVNTNDATVTGRLAFNGIFGSLGFGFAGNGPINHMQSGHVILATRGSDYLPRTGLNLTLGPEVNEYIIDPTQTPFRLWDTPRINLNNNNNNSSSTTSTKSSTKTDLQVHFDSCYTALTFTVASISGQTFNLTGTDTMIWSADDVDTFVQYHGSNRGFATIDWTTQGVSGSSTNNGGGSGGTTSTSGAAASTTSAMSALLVTLAVGVAAIQ